MDITFVSKPAADRRRILRIDSQHSFSLCLERRANPTAEWVYKDIHRVIFVRDCIKTSI
jgi:hypothetical protein